MTGSVVKPKCNLNNDNFIFTVVAILSELKCPGIILLVTRQKQNLEVGLQVFLCSSELTCQLAGSSTKKGFHFLQYGMMLLAIF